MSKLLILIDDDVTRMHLLFLPDDVRGPDLDVVDLHGRLLAIVLLQVPGWHPLSFAVPEVRGSLMKKIF